MLGIIDIKIPCYETKHIIFFLHAFLCKQRCRRHHEWCFSLWLKFVNKGPILPNFFTNKRRSEQDCNIPFCCAEHFFKKSFLVLKNRTFPVKSKVTKIVNKGGHYNSFFLFLFQHFKTKLRRVNETTTNQQDVVLKITQCEIDYHTFNCWYNFQCWLFSL